MKILKYGVENMRKELCETGQHLWEHYRSTFQEDLYENYVNHIKSCSECVQKLGLTKEDVKLLTEFFNKGKSYIGE